MDKTLDLQCKGTGFDSRVECAFFFCGIFFSTSLIIHAAYIYAHRAQRVNKATYMYVVLNIILYLAEQ